MNQNYGIIVSCPWLFVFASAHVKATAHGSKNKDDTNVHHVRTGFSPR
jgi:hypothetical protein